MAFIASNYLSSYILRIIILIIRFLVDFVTTLTQHNFLSLFEISIFFVKKTN